MEVEKLSVMREEITESIFQMLIRENVEMALKEDEVFQEKARIRRELSQEQFEMRLSNDKKYVVERLLHILGEKEAAYETCAYKTGFKDCISVLKALHILG